MKNVDEKKYILNKKSSEKKVFAIAKTYLYFAFHISNFAFRDNNY